MSDDITWSDEGFTGTAYLRRGQQNFSRSFRRINRATGQPEPWGDPSELPRMEIPATPANLSVASVLDVSTGLISWVFDATQSNAALAAGIMWWVEAGMRLGTIRTVEQ